jgi:murein DD-endopeptidase MepM/ murein hydrolase activator NlpD
VNEGKPFAVFHSKRDKRRIAKYVVYEPDVYSYVTFNFSSDSVVITKTIKDVRIEERIISGEICKNSNLSVEINKQVQTYALTAALADGIESIYAWSIDFFKLQEGDKFIVVYDEKSIDGVSYGIGQIKYTWFEHSGAGKYAFSYITDSTENRKGYYDEKAREMKRPFLMSPLKFARMTSAYNLNRIHPIYKQKRAHLGTDYAAPTGTPILATADGTVIKAARGGGNGIYVKLRHNSVYETQYLHMSKHGEGIREGVRVKQGQVIGYVGATGAATGPHVCYRFWKNGKQVDHRAQKFPNSEPMKEELIPGYLKYIEPLKEKLDVVIGDF